MRKHRREKHKENIGGNNLQAFNFNFKFVEVIVTSNVVIQENMMLFITKLLNVS